MILLNLSRERIYRSKDEKGYGIYCDRYYGPCFKLGSKIQLAAI